MRTTKATPQEIADKIESWEGGIEAGLMYFGPELNSSDNELNDRWRTAYAAFKAVEAMLPEASLDE